jgi:hypothetical protein
LFVAAIGRRCAVLHLDRAARLERDRRRKGGEQGRERA